MSSITIAIPTLGDIKSNCVMSIVQSIFIDSNSNKLIKRYTHTISSTISYARNTLCNRFLEEDSEWILFIDSDIDFSYDDIISLYNLAIENSIGVISGIYFSYDENEKRAYPVADVANLNNSLFKTDWSGLGFSLIHRSVLEKTKSISLSGEYHWFAETYMDGIYIGEDIYFSKLLKKNNIDMYVCPKVKLGHNKTIRINSGDFLIES